MQRAFNKYGETNFEFIVLHQCSNNEDSNIVNELEKKYIKLYKDKALAYNIGDGGDGGHNIGKHLSEETKRKIGDKNRVNMTGRKATIETKKKMSEAQKRRFDRMSDKEREEYGRQISQYASGYKWSEESKENFSKIQQSKPNGAKYDVETVKKIRHLHEDNNLSYTEIAKLLNMHRQTVYLIATYRRWKYA